jgi:deoxycytidine triphosphate deaminase
MVDQEVQQVAQAIDPGTDDGRLVSGTALQELLETPEKVFGRPDDFELENLMPTGYHVRLSAAPLVIPTGGKEKSFEYDEEHPFPGHEFVVRPGESAIISTVESFTLDLDVSILIHQRFSWAAKGLLLLHGGTAHPGYGRTRVGNQWPPKDNPPRLYFVVANIGPLPIPLRIGDTIAFLQFVSVTRDVKQKEVGADGWQYLQDKLRSKQSEGEGLLFLRSVSELSDKVDSLEQNVETVEKVTERTNNLSQYVVAFGVYLVAIAILGELLKSLADVLRPVHTGPDDWHVGDYVVMALALGFAAAAILSTYLIWRVVRPSRRREKKVAKLRRTTRAEVKELSETQTRWSADHQQLRDENQSLREATTRMEERLDRLEAAPIESQP